MIQYDSFTLDNGLRFLVHHDRSTPIVAMNILYQVGAKDEHPDKTGFAHLFEHLMFGGSVNIPRYDEPLQQAGGENNAFTNSDYTNYYLTVPKQNLETAFWLESDRMLDLAFSPKSLETQRNVVIEEFRQNYLNQPYGDAWLLLKPLAYKQHPYQWNTIGKETAHIENATLEDVKDFYSKYYNPNNAIVAIAGDVQTGDIKKLAEKWFGSIKSGPDILRTIPSEPKQTEARKLEVKRKVSADSIYLAWHSCGRTHPDYEAVDLVSDLLGSGQSSVLFKELVLEKALFAELSAFVTGDIDPGLLVVTGKVTDGIHHAQALDALTKTLNQFKEQPVSEQSLRKVKNRVITGQVFGDISVLSKAMKLANYTYLGDTALINEQTNRYRSVSAGQIKQVADSVINESNSNTLIYLKDND